MEHSSNIKQIETTEKMESGDFAKLCDEMLLRVFQYSIQDIRSYKAIRDTCKRFKKVVSDFTLYKNIKIVDDASIEETIPILREHRLLIEKLEIRNITSELLNEVLLEASKLENLQSVKIELVRLTHVDLEKVQTIAQVCREIRYFKVDNIVGGVSDIERIVLMHIRLTLEMKRLTLTPEKQQQWYRFLLRSMQAIYELRHMPDLFDVAISTTNEAIGRTECIDFKL